MYNTKENFKSKTIGDRDKRNKYPIIVIANILGK